MYVDQEDIKMNKNIEQNSKSKIEIKKKNSCE